jgi:hypothetical protein
MPWPVTDGSPTHFPGAVAFGRGAYESLKAAKSLKAAASNGKTFGLNLAAGFTVTLPSVASCGAGWRARFRVEIAPTGNYIITEKAASDTDVLIGGVIERETDTNDDGPYTAGFTQVNFILSVAVVGDYIDIECNGVKFFVSGIVTADGAVTLT